MQRIVTKAVKVNDFHNEGLEYDILLSLMLGHGYYNINLTGC